MLRVDLQENEHPFLERAQDEKRLLKLLDRIFVPRLQTTYACSEFRRTGRSGMERVPSSSAACALLW